MDVQVRGRAMLKLYAGAVDTTCEQAARPDPTVPRCRAQSPQVAFSPEQVAIPRAPRSAAVCSHPEGGPGRARMKKRVFTLLLVAGLLAAAALTALTFPALAQTQTVYVRLASGEVVPVTVDVPPGRDARRHPAAGPGGRRPPSAPAPTVPTTPTASERAKAASHDRPRSRPGWRRRARAPAADREQERSSSGRRVQDKSGRSRDLTGDVKARAKHEVSKAKRRGRRSPLRNPDGTPTLVEPELHRRAARPVDRHRRAQLHHPQVPRAALPARRSTRPPGIQYGVRWEVLAAINEIETDYGRNLNVSSAGALGWMQFMPSTWRMYGVDANKDGAQGPVQPGRRDLRRRPLPQGRRLREGRPPRDLRLQPRRLVRRLGAAPRAPDRRRAGRPDRLAHRPDRGPLPRLRPRALRGRPRRAAAAQAASSRARTPPTSSSRATRRRSIDIFATQGAPVVAVNDGVIKKIGKSKKLGRYIVLQDVYGNRYTYAHLGSVSQVLPGAEGRRHARRPTAAPARSRANDVRPEARRARVGRPPARRVRHRQGQGPRRRRAGRTPQASRAGQGAPVRASRHAGRARGRRPRADARLQGCASSGRLRDLQRLLLAPVRPRPSKVRLRPLAQGLARDRRHDPRPRRPDRRRQGARTSTSRSARPAAARRRSTRSRSSTAGSCSRPRRSTAPPAATCSTARTTRTACRSARSCCCRSRCSRSACSPTSASTSTRAAARTSAPARSTAACWRRSSTWPSPACGPPSPASSAATASTRARATSPSTRSGNAVDIAMINGIPILGHQEPGGITEQTVRRLMQLQGTMQPHQIISLLELGGATRSRWPTTPTTSTSGFQPLFGANKKLGKQALAVLKPGQWSDLISRLGEIENPVVPTKPSKYALPAQPEAREPGPRGRVGRTSAAGPFGFVQLEFGFLLGPPDGRYLVRPSADALVESVLVLVDARRARAPPRSGGAAAVACQTRIRRRCPRPARRSSGPTPFSGDEEAAAWLAGARPSTTELDAAVAVLNRALHAHRVAAADPYVGGGVRRARAGGADRLRQRRGGGRRPLRRGLRAAAHRARGARSARWRRPRSASPRSSAAARRCCRPRSWCCAPGPT